MEVDCTTQRCTVKSVVERALLAGAMPGNYCTHPRRRDFELYLGSNLNRANVVAYSMRRLPMHRCLARAEDALRRKGATSLASTTHISRLALFWRQRNNCRSVVAAITDTVQARSATVCYILRLAWAPHVPRRSNCSCGHRFQTCPQTDSSTRDNTGMLQLFRLPVGTC